MTRLAPQPSSTPSTADAPAPGQSGASLWPGRQRAHRRQTILERLEAFISRLSNKNNFWRRVCSLIWLPYAFRSGIRVKRLDSKTFTAVLPFRRFNRNWYNAMAGAALLGNSEIAGGTYVFGVCGSDYRVVCKRLTYEFLRPCVGPAIYRVNAEQSLEAMMERGGEFNVDIRIDIVQQIKRRGKERKVGRCWGTFHVSPKAAHREKRARRKNAPKQTTVQASA